MTSVTGSVAAGWTLPVETRRFDSVEAFLDVCGSFLEAREPEHQLTLGILGDALAHFLDVPVSGSFAPRLREGLGVLRRAMDAAQIVPGQRVRDRLDRLLVVHLGQDHVPRGRPDRGGHHSSVRQRGDERAVVREAAARQRVPQDAERQLMLRLARLEERPTDSKARLDRVESTRLDRHRVSRA